MTSLLKDFRKAVGVGRIEHAPDHVVQGAGEATSARRGAATAHPPSASPIASNW